ncbi:DNA primase family protein [Methylobacterium sp. Leaf113]|uniref:DNA primase family protein n=1 Tax=Methylobacterium sp. Leaf113 TaxID=1736259 RepID=UPI000A55A7D6|nr:DUF5906 domain-containing protein [Methylobacterium sp. Leaf113]
MLPHLTPTAHFSLADDLVALMRDVLRKVYKGGSYLTYTDGVFRYFTGTQWTLLSDAQLGGVILHHLPAAAKWGGQRTRSSIREVIDLLKMHRATSPDLSRLNEPLPIINVANGELWIGENGSVELRAHSPTSGLRYCLDVVYDPAATCPLYDRALIEIFSASENPTSLAAFWDEFTGYVLQPARLDARIFVGWGAGNDGKSALAGMLIRLLGRDRVAAMPVGKLAGNPFMMSHLADKVLFLDDDVAVGTTLPDGLLKTISEAKIVTGEPKYRDAFEFEVRTVPLLLCNRIPHLRDTSYGFRRRLTVIPFGRSFTKHEADPTLFARIYASERSGVLNRALRGLRQVVQRGWKLDPPDAVIAATEAWWGVATGAAPMDDEPDRQPEQSLQRLHRPRIPRPQAASTITHDVMPTGKSTGMDVSVSIEVPETGKSCLVHVQLGQASLRVNGAPTHIHNNQSSVQHSAPTRR